jgi:pimeloyl-ACP methyl ester carboxylesterase
MNLDDRIRARERRLFVQLHVSVRERFLRLERSGPTVRVLESGEGPPLVLLHGVTQSAAVWTPLIPHVPGYRLLAVDLPGHGLSSPWRFERGRVREQATWLLDRLFTAFGFERAPVVAHSLGAMFALWHAAADPRRMSALVAVGDPAVALPGVTVRMPLPLLTLPGVSEALLRAPSPRLVYRAQLAQGLGRGEAGAMPGALLDALRLAMRRPGNAYTVACLMHALNRFRVPRPESVLSDEELAAISTPSLFIWGRSDPYLSPANAAASVARMPAAELREVPGGHAPWLIDPRTTGDLVLRHLTEHGMAPREGCGAPRGGSGCGALPGRRGSARAS